MGRVGITARFPLGVYHGHAADGAAEQAPTPLRLFSALVNAAFTGSTATADGRLDAASAQALDWLEGHPPQGLSLPATAPVCAWQADRVAYRKTGTIEKGRPKTAPKVISDGVALAGQVGWVWEDMPDPVRDTLARLCEDVSCLGETDSPVVLEVSATEANWRWDPAATAFTPGGRRVLAAAPGRRSVLERLHEEGRPRKTPSESADRFRESSDTLRPFPTSTECTRVLHYAPVGQEVNAVAGTPWSNVLVLAADHPEGVVAPERYVGWCVAFHRALVGRIGDGAPPVVTGRYPDSLRVPANRLAIQYVPASLLAQSTVNLEEPAPGAFLVMVPRDISSDDMRAVLAALAGMTELNSRWGRMRLRRHDEAVLASEFWRAPAPGAARLWAPMPAAVPEVTRQRGPWSFDDAILLSLGFVWRDQLEHVGKGAAVYRSLVEQVRGRGAGVLWYQSVLKKASSYAHRMPEGMVAQPYRAQLGAGDLLGERELVAIGQSRHLGGGLLAPVDVPAAMAQGLGR